MTTHVDFLSIDEILSGNRDPEAVAGWCVGTSYRWCDLQAATAAVSDWLLKRTAQKCLLAADDSYAFAIGFLGAAEAGCEILLPSNLKPGHLASIARSADVIVSAAPIDPCDRDVLDVMPLIARPQATCRLRRPIDLSQSRVSIHTSGSTGAPVGIERTLASLAAEVKTLETTFGSSLGGRTLGTVPPWHIYGLLFRVLWPLAAGRPIDGRLLRFPPELMQAARDAGGAITLVSSPAFLSAAAPVLDLAELAALGVTVFSSGGPLPLAAGAAFNGAGVPLVEVYGSTETGGVAHRRSFDPDMPAPWTPFASVSVSRTAEGRLAVNSPHLYRPGNMICADEISQPAADGSFQLLGRVDRTVKIAENRVSLPALEAIVGRLPGIDQVRLVSIERKDKLRLGAVLVLSDAGWTEYVQMGRAAFTRKIADYIAESHVSAAIPKYWRMVRQLPMNAQGKVAEADLQSLFLPDQGRVTEPTVLSQELDAANGLAKLALRLDADVAYFDGHFADDPILPGVAQIGWAVRYAQLQFGLEEPCFTLETIKFFRIATVNDVIRLELRHDRAAGKVHFTYSGEAGLHSSGSLIFRVPV